MIGVVTDVTGMRHIEHALEVRQAVTAALAEWHVLGFDGLLGPLGSALAADACSNRSVVRSVPSSMSGLAYRMTPACRHASSKFSNS